MEDRRGALGVTCPKGLPSLLGGALRGCILRADRQRHDHRKKA
jgi:hypothetical protein